MTRRIDDIFASLRARGGKALMPFICGSFPTPGATRAVLPALQRAGASIVEIGIPFSDPIADGPIIAAAMHTALQRGATPAGVFDEIREARAEVSLGIVAMISVSIVWRVGLDRLLSHARDVGIDGFIYPDLILDEASTVLAKTNDAGMTASLLISPTTPFKRAEAIAKACTGFVYLLARAGITGEQTEAPEVASRVGKLKQVTDLPIAVGFGISSADHVRAVTRSADAAIVGSAMVRRIAEAHGRGEDPTEAAASFCASLAQGVTSDGVNAAAGVNG